VYLEPEVVPLQSLGVVDVGGTDLDERDALSSALANVSEADQRKSFAVKRGNEFVNEYARERVWKVNAPMEGPVTLTIYWCFPYAVLLRKGRN